MSITLRDVVVNIMFKVDAKSLNDTTGTIKKFNNMVDDIKVISAINKLNMLRYAYYTLKNTIQGVVDAFTYFVQAGAAQEVAFVSFSTMLGSETKALALLKDLNKLAVDSAFGIKEVEENASMLLAMGTPQDNLISTMKMLGDITAALPNLTFKRLALNYGQVLSAGVLTGRELRDFISGGVPILKELEKMTGRSSKQIRADIASRAISADMVTQAFKNLTSAGGMFFKMTEKKAYTTGGRLQAIAESWELVARKVGLMLNEKLKPYLATILDFMNKNGDKITAIFMTLMGRGIDFAALIVDVLSRLIHKLSWFVDNSDLVIGAINGLYDALVLLTGVGIVTAIGAMAVNIHKLILAFIAFSGTGAAAIMWSFYGALAKIGAFFTVGLGSVILFGTALALIILYIEDLFTFMTDPEAESTTKWFYENTAAGYILVEMLKLIGNLIAGIVRALFTFDFSQLSEAILNIVNLTIRGIASLFSLENFDLTSVVSYWYNLFNTFIAWLTSKWESLRTLLNTPIVNIIANVYDKVKNSVGGMNFGQNSVMGNALTNKPTLPSPTPISPSVSNMSTSNQHNTVSINQTINGGNPVDIEKATRAALKQTISDAQAQRTNNKAVTKS